MRKIVAVFIVLTLTILAAGCEGSQPETRTDKPAIFQKSQEKQEALRKIEGFYDEATFNRGAIVDIARMVPEATHNISVLTHCAYLASKFGYHTGPLVEIAGLAASCAHECPELYELAELDVMKMGDSQRLMQIAQSAVEAWSEDLKEQLRQDIEEFRATADYKSIAEALKAQQQRDEEEKIPISELVVDSQEKLEALNKIQGILNEAQFHGGAIEDIARELPEAEYNISVITHCAYLASKFGYHTGPLIDIAKLAASCDHECPELYELAELNVMKKSDSAGLMRLAQLAVEAQTEEEKEQLRLEIDEFRASADYESLAEALEAQHWSGS